MRYAIAAILLLLAASPASAHLAGGSDVVVDGYILDFGYDPAPANADGPVTLAFNMADERTKEAVSPDSVWVRIMRGGTVAFAGALEPADGSATVQLRLPDVGDYEVTARYGLAGREFEGTFALDVAASAAAGPVPAATSADPTSLAALVAIVAGAIGYAAGRRRPAH